MSYVIPKKDQEILDLFYSGNEKRRELAFRKLDKRMRRKAVGWVINQKVAADKAHTIFNKALMRFEKKVMAPEFKLTGKLDAYLMGIVRFIWMEEREAPSPNVPIEEKIYQIAYPQSFNEEKELLFLSFQKCLKQLNQDCKRILFYKYYLELPMVQIANLLGYSGAHAVYTAANKRSRCLKKLVKECK